MSRLLAIVERRVTASERGAYLASLARRRQDASTAGVQCWAFEHVDEPGRFIEFTESGDADAIRGVAGHEADAHLWRELHLPVQQEGES